MKMRHLFFVLMLATCVAPALQSQEGAMDVTGKWSFNVETSAGSGTPIIELKQQGEKLTGHYTGQLGEADLTGTVKGREIAFTFTANVQGYSLKTTYTGTIENKDSLKGTLSIEGLGDGTFTAKRQ